MANTARVYFALMLGSVAQWFVFIIAAVAAASVWPYIFFTPAQGLLLSVVAYGAAYVARPVGAALFGYIGDTAGRKASFVSSLFLLAATTIAIGLTPTFNEIGVAASIMVVSFRVLQGCGVGGYWGSAATYISEVVAKSRWRVFWASSVQAAVGIGEASSALAFALASALTDKATFLGWGWRTIFILGACLVLAAGLVTYRLGESPLFEELRSQRDYERVSEFQVLKENSRKVMLLVLAELYEVGTATILVFPLSIAYLTALNASGVIGTLSVAASGVFGSIAVFASGVASGLMRKKKPILLVSTVVSAIVLSYPYLYLVRSGSTLLIFLGQMLVMGAIEMGYAVIAPIFAENFPTKYRSSGVGISYQLSAAIAGLINLTLVPFLLTSFHGIVGAFPYVALTCAVLSAVSLLAASTVGKETAELQF